MKALKLHFYLIFSLSAVACAKSSERHHEVTTQSPSSPAPEQRELDRIEGEKPYDFFKHFFFRDTDSCERPWYTIALSDSFLLAPDEKGREVLGVLRIMILPSNVYYVKYEESVITTRFPHGYGASTRSKIVFSGAWSIRRKVMVLNGLGYATGVVENGQKAMRLVVDRDLGSPGLSGLMMLVHRMHSNNLGVRQLDRCQKGG